MSRWHWRWEWTRIEKLTLATVIAAVVVPLAVYELAKRSTSPAQTTKAREGPPAPIAPPPPPSPAVGKPLFLDQLSMDNESGDPAGLGVANVAGRKFEHGLTMTPGSFTTSDEPQSVRFTLPRPFTRFRAVVGINPNVAPGFQGSMGVSVSEDDRVVASTVVNASSGACGIDARISGAQSLVVSAYYRSGEPLGVVFGDPRVIARKDFDGMPSKPTCP